MQDGEKIIVCNFKGKKYDIGNKIGILKAKIEFGMRNPKTKKELKNCLKDTKKD